MNILQKICMEMPIITADKSEELKATHNSENSKKIVCSC